MPGWRARSEARDGLGGRTSGPSEREPPSRSESAPSLGAGPPVARDEGGGASCSLHHGGAAWSSYEYQTGIVS